MTDYIKLHTMMIEARLAARAAWDEADRIIDLLEESNGQLVTVHDANRALVMANELEQKARRLEEQVRRMEIEADPLDEFLMATDDGEVDWAAEFSANRQIAMGG